MVSWGFFLVSWLFNGLLAKVMLAAESTEKVSFLKGLCELCG